jgi:hypothetical protein
MKIGKKGPLCNKTCASHFHLGNTQLRLNKSKRQRGAWAIQDGGLTCCLLTSGRSNSTDRTVSIIRFNL